MLHKIWSLWLCRIFRNYRVICMTARKKCIWYVTCFDFLYIWNSPHSRTNSARHYHKLSLHGQCSRQRESLWVGMYSVQTLAEAWTQWTHILPTYIIKSKSQQILMMITHNDASQSVGHLWSRDQPVAETSTWQYTTLTTDRYPWARRDSSPQSQEASGRRPRP
jgi:hypothetical protein